MRDVVFKYEHWICSVESGRGIVWSESYTHVDTFPLGDENKGWLLGKMCRRHNVTQNVHHRNCGVLLTGYERRTIYTIRKADIMVNVAPIFFSVVNGST